MLKRTVICLSSLMVLKGLLAGMIEADWGRGGQGKRGQARRVRARRVLRERNPDPFANDFGEFALAGAGRIEGGSVLGQ